MQQKFNVGICTFSYGGNGGISSEVPDIREWMTPLVASATRDERIGTIRIWNLADTPITMTRNRAVLMAREYGVDVLVMVDSDMKPDLYIGQDASARPFFDSSFDFLVKHYSKGPCVIGAPYCGPPPNECVYVFRWQSMQSEHPNPDFQLEMYDRHTAVKLAGIQECAALPTGLIMYDMRAFDITEPKDKGDNPWFYYEWSDKYAANKSSTEDVTMTRDLSLKGAEKLGYNPVMCNWDAWAGHWKPKCVGKPQFIDASAVASKMRESFEANVDPNVKLVDLKADQDFLRQIGALKEFNSMGMELAPADEAALKNMIKGFFITHGRAPRVCEIGSWAGRSATIMAKAGARVHCVDTWTGNAADEGTKHYDASNGLPLDVFKKNTNGLGITYTVGKSPDIASQFGDGEFDIVYIDAEHTYESVMADIKAWKPKARHLIAGHDYHLFEGVKKAVADSGLLPTVSGNVWISSV